ncbi:type III secretion system stalk subunit SctO [Caenimonas koreensis]|uniref:type III secretion system stalk subunit SctO n=1 Tax=Caenimonas koreensis TaxID=367474 RepID=UPI003783BDCC
MDVIDGLLHIKRIREECREAEMRRARQHLELASEALRRSLEQQRERDKERVEREESLYTDVCARVVVVRELHDLKHEVDSMKEAAKLDAKAVADAQETRVMRRKTFDDSVTVWRMAALAASRFQDLSETQQLEREKHAEWLAELELEEFAGRGPVILDVEEIQEEA